MYEMTAVYLKKVQDDLKTTQQNLIHTNKNLTDSINYAKHIQDAFMVQISVLQRLFPKSFIFQQPKDIVSGDFIWEFENESMIFLGIGDCTGHGVPGAMLSIFVISMLNQIVNHYDNETPAGILEQLDVLMQKYLSQYTDQLRDSAELSIIRYDIANRKLLFSGAKRPLLLIRNGVVTCFDGAKYVLGNAERRNELVVNTEIDLQTNDMLYMFSDGFADQFGGAKNSKFTSKRLITLLQEASDLPTDQQYEKIASTFFNWQGTNSQIDDVLLLGIRI
jgi:serine phosphatase RsbU (regulator of sigma subunit)